MSTPPPAYPVEPSAWPTAMNQTWNPTPTPPKRNRSWLWAAGGIVMGAVVGVLSTLAATGTFEGSSSFVLNGTITVSGGPDTVATSSDGTGCQGTGGYSDITPGTAVTVANAQGQVIATGALGSGVMASSGELDACSLSFTVPDVPDGLPSYSITISHRGPQVVPSTEAHSGVALSLGD